MRLPKKVKNMWLTALRSGEFEQATGALANTEGTAFCCLGVLQYCTHGGKIECNIGSKKGNLRPHGAPSAGYWASIGAKCTEAAQEELVDMNDANPSIGFKKIAGWISRNVKTY